MPLLSTDDLIKKSKDKGFTKKAESTSPAEKEEEDFFSPWQQNSLLNDKKVIPFSLPKQDNDLETNLDNKTGFDTDNKLDIQLDVRTDNDPDNKTRPKSDTERDNNSDLIERTSRKQPDNIQITSREHRDTKRDNYQITSREQIRDYPGIELDNNQDTERDNKLLRHHLISLSGIQKNLFDYVLEDATYNDGFITGFICTKIMASEINCSYDTAKMTLNRLIQKGILIRQKGKGCRGGYIILEIPKNVKNVYLESKRGIKRGVERDNKPEIMHDHYNNSSSKITTMTGGWEKINFTALIGIGFEESTLLEVMPYTTPEIVQESINRFAFALQHDERVKSYKSKLGSLISVLKDGRMWQKHEKYRTPEELDKERLTKEAEEAAKKAEIMAKQLFEVKFNEWFSRLAPAEQSKKPITDHQSDFKKGAWQEIRKAWA